MQLTVRGLTQDRPQFKHLFGRYVLGFKPWTHCDQCFDAKRAPAVHPSMANGPYQLDASQPYFYLCGVGQPERKRDGEAWMRRHTNVHLAVRPRLGSVAAVGSVYGVSFVIEDAEAIPILPIGKGFAGLSEKFTRCKNFQFAHQTFEAEHFGESAPRIIIRTLRASA